MAETKNKILIVDDDPDINLAIHRLLSAAGFPAAAFLSAEELLKDGAASTAECLVLDINLPGASGFELYRQLADSGVHVPVIFITALDDSDWQARAQSVGATAYLTKPFEGERLLSAIEKALEGA
jgi:FixJ family two-component response regulator